MGRPWFWEISAMIWLSADQTARRRGGLLSTRRRNDFLSSSRRRSSTLRGIEFTQRTRLSSPADRCQVNRLARTLAHPRRRYFDSDRKLETPHLPSLKLQRGRRRLLRVHGLRGCTRRGGGRTLPYLRFRASLRRLLLILKYFKLFLAWTARVLPPLSGLAHNKDKIL
jgi:hypothetical protein